MVTFARLAAVLAGSVATVIGGAPPPAALEIANVSAALTSVGQFERYEIRFTIAGTVATQMTWPYEASPPQGVQPGLGISVDGVFTDPDGQRHRQPAFYEAQFLDEVREGRDWHLPTGVFHWTLRFTPHKPGLWNYSIVAKDAGGTFETPAQRFLVTPSSRKGFVRVSARDSRYFEFDDGSLFTGVGVQVSAHLDNPTTKGAAEYEQLGANGVNFARVWISSIFGAAWNTWIGGRNQQGGYLPYTGLVPFTDRSGQTKLALKLDYEPEGDTGWFDACRMQLWWWDEAEAVRPNATYRLRVEYHGADIAGPRVASQANFGLVAKIGGWFPNCHEPRTSTVVTSYGGNSDGFKYIEGIWKSGRNNFLPRMYLALENVTGGAAWVRSVSLREELPGGTLGPELMIQPSMERELYVPHEKAYALDKIVALAEQTGVYLKLVVMEKDDDIYRKLDDSGNWTGIDNHDGFYGVGRTVNKTRWLQQSWWRYLQARWGYSTAIHSWELTNEGDPVSTRHYQLADEFGKYMHCRVFGEEPGRGDAAACTFRHPNAHLTTTSFWHSFPATQFWASRTYPNVDYADVHAYVSSSYAPRAERQTMQSDAAYYHAWHSQDLAQRRVGKPIVRGEAGLDSVDAQSDAILGLDRDRGGVWLHTFLWSTLDAGGLNEIYWWTSHIWSASFDHRPAYRAFRAFMADLPLNKGGYVHWGGSVTNDALRVVGQKNVAAGSAHLWVQNRRYTWRNVVDRATIAPESGDVLLPGFTAGAEYELTRWDTHAVGGAIVGTERIIADGRGGLRIPIASLRTDVAIKVRPVSHSPSGRPRL